MGNEQSDPGSQSAANNGERIFTVSAGGSNRNKRSHYLEVLESLPEVYPLTEERGRTEAANALLPEMLASLLPLQSSERAQDRSGKMEEVQLQRLMQGLDYTEESGRLAERQRQILATVREIREQLVRFQVEQESTQSSANRNVLALNRVERLEVTVARIAGRVEDILSQLTPLVACLPADDPLSSFDAYVRSRRQRSASGRTGTGSQLDRTHP